MSVTFNIRGMRGIDACGMLNLANANAREILATLGLDSDYLCGEARGRDLRRRCEIALGRTHDGDAEQAHVDEGRVIFCGRRAGYVTERVRAILQLADMAGDLGIVSWG